MTTVFFKRQTTNKKPKLKCVMEEAFVSLIALQAQISLKTVHCNLLKHCIIVTDLMKTHLSQNVW